ncbi:hypothetical protein, partial [Duganella sp. Leaf61]|uniref:hypothetical protein n=1 Tax=Duganella sp. Leaf61 TaxID=1736227 RepID=UPI001E5B5DB7
PAGADCVDATPMRRCRPKVNIGKLNLNRKDAAERYIIGHAIAATLPPWDDWQRHVLLPFRSRPLQVQQIHPHASTIRVIQ